MIKKQKNSTYYLPVPLCPLVDINNGSWLLCCPVVRMESTIPLTPLLGIFSLTHNNRDSGEWTPQREVECSWNLGGGTNLSKTCLVNSLSKHWAQKSSPYERWVWGAELMNSFTTGTVGISEMSLRSGPLAAGLAIKWWHDEALPSHRISTALQWDPFSSHMIEQ